MLRRVQPKSVDTFVDPKLRDLLDLLAHLRLVEVQVRHDVAEQTKVTHFLPGGAFRHVPGPRRRRDVDIPEVVEAAKLGRWIFHRLREPGMLVRGVIECDIQNDPDAALMGGLDQILHIPHRPVARIDRLVIVDIVSVVTTGRKDRHQPENSDLEIVIGRRIPIIEIVELFPDPLQIPDFPTVRSSISLRIRK